MRAQRIFAPGCYNELLSWLSLDSMPIISRKRVFKHAIVQYRGQDSLTSAATTNL